MIVSRFDNKICFRGDCVDKTNTILGLSGVIPATPHMMV